MAGIDWTAAYRAQISRQTFLTTATVAVGFSTLLTACGGEDDNDAPDATATTSGAGGSTTGATPSAAESSGTTPSTGDGEAKQGGTLRMGFFRSEIITLDPALVNIG